MEQNLEQNKNLRESPNSGQCLAAKRELSLFEKLVNKAVMDKAQEKRVIESDLKIASSIILEKAAASLPPDRYQQLEQTLVDLYMIYNK